MSERPRDVEQLLLDNEELRRRIAELEAQGRRPDPESAARLHILIEEAPVCVATVGPDKRFLTCNRAFCEFLGRSEDELKQMSIGEVTLPADLEIGMLDLQAIAKGLKKSSTVQKRYVRKDGAVVWGEVNINLVRDDQGRPRYFLAIIQDLTERKRAEERLRASEETLRGTLRHLDDGFYSVTGDGVIIDHNRAFNRILGEDPDRDMRGQRSPDFWRNADDRQAYLKELLAKGSIENFEAAARRVDGSEIVVLVSAHVVKDASGGLQRIEGTVRDITERMRADEALRRSEERFRIAAASVGDLIWDWHIPEGRLEWFGSIDALLGFEPGGFPRTLEAWEAVIHEEDRPRVMASLERHLAASEPYRQEYRVRRKDGSLAHWIDRGTAIRDSSGTAVRMIGACEDATARKQAEADLRRHRDHLEELVAERTAELRASKHLLDETGRLARVGGWEIDLRKNELTWSDVVHQIHEVEPGYRPTVEAGIRFYAPEAVPVISEAVRRAMEEGTPFDLELQLITARQNRLWVRAVGEAIREGGAIVKVRGVFQDIDERRRVELELQRHREHLEELVNERTTELAESRRALVEAQTVARVGSWAWNAVRDEISGSDEFYRLFDTPPDGLRRFAQFIGRLHPDDRERVQQEVAEALKLDRPYDTDYRVELRAGGWRDINARGRVFTDDGGTPVRMVGTCLDVTERKAIEGELHVKDQAFENSIASQSVADKEGVITHVNPAFLRLWGYARREDALGKSVGSFFADPADAAPVLEALTTRDRWEGEFRARRTDGSTFVSRGYATSLRNAQGALTGYQSTNLDVTPIREAERQLRALNENLERSNQELEQFAYVASHDLQEPLRMVSSFTQLLAQRYGDKLDQDAREFIGFAVDGANRMQRLIQDLLAYSRVTTRGRPPAPLDAHDALGEAVSNLQVAIQESQALVTNDELPRVLGDPTQIVQVFQNLLGNAIKFRRPDAPPRVHVSAQACAEQPGFWTFRVQDNGIGIEPRHFSRLFVIFQRLHGKQEYPGTGIGLALCKRIVERHGGKIWLESEAGKGTTVLCTLPVADPGRGAK